METYSLHVQTGNLVLLEQGRAPVKGLSRLKVFLWVPDPILPDITESLMANMQSSSLMQVDAADPSASTTDAPQHDVLVYESFQMFERLRLHKAGCIQRIGAVHAMESKTLAEVQEVMFQLLREFLDSSRAELASQHRLLVDADRETDAQDDIYLDEDSMHVVQDQTVPARRYVGEVCVSDLSSRVVSFISSTEIDRLTADHLLMRELKTELLPGRIYWTSDNSTSGSGGGTQLFCS
jgi:hypothetical protein